MNDPLKYFRVESREILEQLQSGLLELERSTPPPALVQKLLRLAHTLKGAARVVKQPGIADLAHRLEDLLLPLKQAQAPLSHERASELLAVVDELAVMVSALNQPVAANAVAGAMVAPAAQVTPTPTIAATAAAVPSQEPGPLRSSSVAPTAKHLDSLIRGVEELGVQLGSLRRVPPQLSQAQGLAEELRRRLEPRRAAELGPGVAPLRALATELETRLAKLERELSTHVSRASRELGQLRDRVDQLRLIHAGSIFGGLERTARDAAVSLGKSAIFEAHGGDIRLDADVLSAVDRALVQAVRNAVAHGLETNHERGATGKPFPGRITLKVERVGSRVRFRCQDDGRGVDLAAVRRSALKQGRIQDKNVQIDDRQLLDLLLTGGISTAEEVSQVAGRGVGLDLIRESLASLGGSVTLTTEQGIGTQLTLDVPASLTAVEGLLVEAQGVVYVLPLSAVSRALRMEVTTLSRTPDGAALSVDGRTLPFVPLAALMGQASGNLLESRPRWSALLVNTRSGLLALGVDRLLGGESVVSRAVPDSVLVAPCVVGVCLDAEGKPRLLLDPDALWAMVSGHRGPSQSVGARKRRILVVDDSLTTRMLEESILESAGYEVELATSGEEGLERALSHPHDLFLVDVEMPGMDGFAFVERAAADPRLASTPAVLVTSRSTPEDVARGRAAGARDHIAKGEFDQGDFLERIERLMS